MLPPHCIPLIQLREAFERDRRLRIAQTLPVIVGKRVERPDRLPEVHIDAPVQAGAGIEERKERPREDIWAGGEPKDAPVPEPMLDALDARPRLRLRKRADA